MFAAIRNLFSSKKKIEKRQKQKKALGTIKLEDNEDLYEALDKRGLLRKPSFPESLGLHLIPKGSLGLALVNGKPQFLTPGRYTFWSIFTRFKKVKSITDDNIKLGSIQIVTIKQGYLGLSVKNGKNIILKPGRYILEAPQVFVEAKAVNEQFIELGTHREITVSEGFVAIARDKGKQIIILPAKEDKPYITDSESFSFNPATGFKSVQIEEKELNELPVFTNESIKLTVKGLILYKIKDPETAFLKVDDVHASIKRRAIAVLTSSFGQLSINEISKGLADFNNPQEEKDEKKLELVKNELIGKATNKFFTAFKEIADKWGVEVINLNISSLTFSESAIKEVLGNRTKQRMEAETNTLIIEAQNAVELKKAENEAQQKIILAEADRKAALIKAETEAQATLIKAEANKKAAEMEAKAYELLQKVPLAARVTELEAFGKALNGKTLIIPNSSQLNLVCGYGEGGINQSLFAPPTSLPNNAPSQVLRPNLSSTNTQ